MEKNLKDKSFGVILFKKHKNFFKVLVVQHKDGHFTPPKGHKILKEKSWETALRELYEESGIKNVCILVSRNIKDNYKFKKNGKTYEKTVIYFVGYPKRKEKITIRDKYKNEIKKGLWIDEKKIQKYLFPSTLKIIKKGLKIFKKIYERY